MRNRASLTLFIFLILLVIILAQNGALNNFLSGLFNSTPSFYASTAVGLPTTRPLVFSTAVPNNVFPTVPLPSPYVPTYAAAYPPGNPPTAQPGNGVAGGTSGVLSSSGQCIVPNGWVAYTVQNGDTLATIAQEYGVTVEKLTAANCLDNPDMIYKGQVLAVPPRH